MFEVRNKYGTTCMNSDSRYCRYFSLAKAKEVADTFCDESGRKDHFSVVEIKTVYVTSTIADVDQSA